MNIRKCALSDLPYLYEICLKTGDNGRDATELFFDKNLLGHIYVAPYALFSSDFSFVLENDYGVPCGYILGTPSTAEFNRKRSEFLRPLENLCKNSPCKTQTEQDVKNSILYNINNLLSDDEKRFIQDFPAHLHIDILSGYQGMHCGKKLMETFLQNLAENGVKGVHLGVGGKNTGAIAFYKKQGFEELLQAEWGFYLGKRL